MSTFRGMKSLCATAVGVGVVIALLSGCTPGPGAQPEPTTDPQTATAPATPAPSQEETPPPAEPEQPAVPAIDLEDPSSWLIGFDGIGPVAQGGPIAEVRPAMAAFVEDELPEWCPAARFTHDGALVLVAHLSDDFSTITDMSLSGWDSSADVSNSSPHTAEGIRIGSSLAELLAAYPDIAKSGEYGGGDNPTLYYAVPGDARVWIVFSVYDDTVRGIFVRDTPTPPSEYCT